MGGGASSSTDPAPTDAVINDVGIVHNADGGCSYGKLAQRTATLTLGSNTHVDVTGIPDCDDDRESFNERGTGTFSVRRSGRCDTFDSNRWTQESRFTFQSDG